MDNNLDNINLVSSRKFPIKSTGLKKYDKVHNVQFEYPYY